MAQTMKALVLEAHGDIDTLKVVDDYPRPSPGPGEVLIRVSLFYSTIDPNDPGASFPPLA